MSDHKVFQMDVAKIYDLAKGKTMEKILRTSGGDGQ